MRVSVWQQFTANHSASFIIVGTFHSAEDAQQSAEFLRGIIRRIALYWQQLPANERDKDFPETTPVEQALISELSLEPSRDWEGHPLAIDWIPPDLEAAAKAVTVIDNYVFIENVLGTWVGSEPFETLLRRTATTVAGNYEIHKAGAEFLGTKITAHAPDEATADKLVADFRETGERTGDYSVNGQVLYDGHLVRQGLELTYSGLTFWHPLEIVQAVPDLLRALGCTDIRVEFFQA
jgi:hypothetical protein